MLNLPRIMEPQVGMELNWENHLLFMDFRETGSGGRKRDTNMREQYWLIASHPHPHTQGIKPTTFWCRGQHSNQMSHLARARPFIITTMRSVKPKLAYSKHCIRISDSLIDLDTQGVLLLSFPLCAMRVTGTTITNASFQHFFPHSD